MILNFLIFVVFVNFWKSVICWFLLTVYINVIILHTSPEWGPPKCTNFRLTHEPWICLWGVQGWAFGSENPACLSLHLPSLATDTPAPEAPSCEPCGPPGKGMTHSSPITAQCFASWGSSLCFSSHRTSHDMPKVGVTSPLCVSPPLYPQAWVLFSAEAPKMSFSKWLNKQTVIQPDNGILFSAKKQWAIKPEKDTEEP